MAEAFLGLGALGTGGGLGAIGTAVSALGTIASAMAQANAAETNAKIAKINAETSLQQAGAEEETQRRKAARVLGMQRAGIAQSGAEFSGSLPELVEDSETQAELDALNIRYRGQVEATGYRNQARVAEAEADQAMLGGVIGAGTSLLSGYSNLRRSSLVLN